MKVPNNVSFSYVVHRNGPDLRMTDYRLTRVAKSPTVSAQAANLNALPEDALHGPPLVKSVPCAGNEQQRVLSCIDLRKLHTQLTLYMKMTCTMYELSRTL